MGIVCFFCFLQRKAEAQNEQVCACGYQQQMVVMGGLAFLADRMACKFLLPGMLLIPWVVQATVYDRMDFVVVVVVVVDLNMLVVAAETIEVCLEQWKAGAEFLISKRCPQPFVCG